MGLSVAISGGIILTVFVLILLSLPGLAEKMFSIGDITSQVSELDDLVSKTEISIEEMYTKTGSPRVNFTLNNEGSITLWDFNNFNVLVEYTGAISGQKIEQLSYNGECLGAVPPAGQWCIQSILNDVADPKLLNSDEQARIRTRLSENLASNTAIITVATDNGVTFTTGGPQCESGLVLPSCQKFGIFQPVTGITQVDGLLSSSTFPAPTEAVSDDPEGVRLAATTQAPVGGDAGLFGSVSIFHREWDAYLDARIQVTNTTNSRLQVGFTSDSSLDNNNTFCNGDSCATVAIRTADATYQYIVNDGDAAQDVTDSGIAESTNVVRIQVRFDSANNRVGFTINDNPETFITTEIPADTTDLFPVVLLENSVANQRQIIEIYYVFTTETK